MAMDVAKGGTRGKEGKLLTLWSLELGCGPQRERVFMKTSCLGSYKPPMMPDIWDCLAGLRLNARWVVQYTGTLHTSGPGVNSLSLSISRKHVALGRILECFISYF